GDTFEQDVPPCEQADQDALNKLILTNNNAFDLVGRTLQKLDVSITERGRTARRRRARARGRRR
ncbi:hypothetical protein GOEFS_105_00010, partial [Gordonia effusa NBRC 100432]